MAKSVVLSDHPSVDGVFTPPPSQQAHIGAHFFTLHPLTMMNTYPILGLRVKGFLYGV